MAATAPNFTTLEAALDDLGQAWVLVGDPFTSGGLSVLGLTPGDFAPSMNPQFQERVYEEYSRQPVSAKIVGYDVQVDIPIIWGHPDIYATISPEGTAYGGHTTPQDPTYTTLVLVPTSEFGSNWSHDGTDWVYPVGGPSHAVWIPKGYFQGAFPIFGSLNTENKNRTGTVTFRGVLSDSANWPEGAKSWVIGNPEDAGVTALEI